MLEKHFVYVAEKTQYAYAREMQQACAEPSLPERLASRLLSALRHALAQVSFPAEQPAASPAPRPSQPQELSQP
ncbi:MAG: hypothetical protein Kow0077_13240 [Anaerolineae bacterium]